MWIAKPIQALTEDERSAWNAIETEAPLSQTLAWANAIQAVSGRSFLVFSPDEMVGGIVFCATPKSSQEGSHLECVNGPILNWDNPHAVTRQFATFAMAASKLDRNFRSLSLKPRWESSQTDQRLSLLPISPTARVQAATLVVPIKKSENEQFQSFHSRMRRTLSTTWKTQIETSWERVTADLLTQFVPALSDFGKRNSFSVPPLPWFLRLTQTSEGSSSQSKQFWLATSVKHDNHSVVSKTQVLIWLKGNRAYYLFGYENRASELKSSISTSAAAQWEVIRQCSRNEILNYDLNGYLIDASPNHPYYGVCRFKEQFAGQVIQYDHPEFLIE
jgi:lipid II:glycine glycyltransferase (peptidoglycan interpeptide bridge formation enzyme)